MAKTYRPFEPDQMFLMPPSLIEWLPEDHLEFFLRDVLKKIDLSPVTSMYEREERGYPPYHAHMMTGLLLYGYATGVWSPRKLEKWCQEVVQRMPPDVREKAAGTGHLIKKRTVVKEQG